MNQSELATSSCSRAIAKKANSSERALSSKSSTKRLRASSRSSSVEPIKKCAKPPKKKSMKLPRGDTSQWKKVPTQDIDESLKLREAKIKRMEREFSRK